MKLAKYKVGQRAKFDLGTRTDYPAVGTIIKIELVLGTYRYKIRFDHPLFRRPIVRQVYSLQCKEDCVTIIKK